MIREQMCDLEAFSEENNSNGIIQNADSVNGIFEFYADKKLIREIYVGLIKEYPKFKIISDEYDYDIMIWQEIEKDISFNEEIYSNVKNEIIESIFLNPASDFIQIDFSNYGSHAVQLINTTGKIVLT